MEEEKENVKNSSNIKQSVLQVKGSIGKEIGKMLILFRK
jgi:hypothetical protein